MRTPKVRRFKVRVVTPHQEWWSEPLLARTMQQALGHSLELLPPVLQEAATLAAIARGAPGWCISVVPEESWPAAERERELALADPPF